MVESVLGTLLAGFSGLDMESGQTGEAGDGAYNVDAKFENSWCEVCSPSLSKMALRSIRSHSVWRMN